MKIFKTTLFVVLAVVIFFVVKTLWQAGTFKTIKPHYAGKIQALSGMIGVEDISIDQATGIAFLSSDDRRATLAGTPTKGAIYLLNLNENSAKPINLTANLPQNDFHPHGISLWKSPTDSLFLFVVNHRAEKACVDIFQFSNNQLIHKAIINNPLFISPNDIVAVGENSFYVTNDHNMPLSALRTLTDYLKIGTGNVVYYDGKEAKILDKDILYANGINVSQDGKKVFMASTTGNKIIVYDRNESNGELIKQDEIALGTGPDNIEFDSEGNLWIGCHPKVLAFTAHAKDKSKLSPSQVMKVKYTGKNSYEINEIYLNDGSEISGSSVGAVWKNKLLIGSVFEPKILIGEER